MVFATLGVLTAYFLHQDIDEYIKTGRRPSLVFEDIHIRVYKSGKPQWECSAGEITVNDDRTEYELKDLRDGLLNRRDKPPFRFAAEHGYYNTTRDELEVDKPVRFNSDNGDFLYAGNANWDGKRNQLSIMDRVEAGLDGNTYLADSLESRGEKLDIAVLRGNVKAVLPDMEKTGSKNVKTEIEETKVEKKHFKDFTVTAHEMQYNSNRKELVAYPKIGVPIFVPGGKTPAVSDQVALTTSTLDVKALELFVRFEDKNATARGEVKIHRKAEKPDPEKSRLARSFTKRDVWIDTAEMTYFWREKRVEVPSEMTLRQAKLNGMAGRATIFTSNEWSRFDGGVMLHQKSGEWLTEDGIVKKTAPERTKEIARADTEIQAGAALINFDTEDISASGSVKITQKNRSLVAGSAEYSGDTKTWRILGSPVARDKEDSLAADIFILDDERDLFIAMGGANSVFLPDNDDREDLDGFFDERDGKSEKRDEMVKDKVSIKADLIERDERGDTVEATGNAVIKYRDVTFSGPKMLVDFERKTITGENGVTIRDKYSETRADKVFADWSANDATLSGGVEMLHTGRKETKDRKEIEPFTLKADKLDYNWKSKKGTAGGKPVMTSRGRWVSADRIDFDAGKGLYDLHGGVKMHQNDGRWLKEKGYIDDDDDERIWKVARDAADAWCDEAHFNEEKDYFRMNGNVRIEQKDRNMASDWLEMDGKRKRFAAGGSVHLFQTRGDWLFEADLVDKDEDEDVKKRVRGRLDVYADLLESNYGDKKMHLGGNVYARQDESTFEGEHVWHDDKTKKTIIEGNVRVNDEDGKALKAERVVYDGRTKVMEAHTGISGAGYIERK